MPTVNTNSFQQAPIQGDLDLQVMRSSTVTGQLSANQATALNAGTAVVLDSGITSGNFPQFIACPPGTKPFGYIKRTMKQTVFNPAGANGSGDKIEVCGFFGNVMWLLANMTIPCGSAVEQSTNGAAVQVAGTGASYAKIGIALDPMVNGQLGRVILSSTPS